jgi:multidrug efflux system membrane fusion protein
VITIRRWQKIMYLENIQRWYEPHLAKRPLVFVVVGAIVLALVSWAFLHQGTAKASAPPAVPVTVARAMRQDMPVVKTELGAAQAWTSVTVLAQVSGKLIKVNFAEGTDVKAGEVLAEIDPTTYRAALEQAEGSLRRDRASLAEAKIDLDRYSKLVAVQAISQQQYQTQAALVEQDEGVVESDEGTVKIAQTNLQWSRIVAPITGRSGVRLVDPGNIVSASGGVASAPATAAATNTSSPASTGGSGIVVINEIQPIAVTFTVPEGDFQNLMALSSGFRAPLLVRAYSQETGALLDTGDLSIADNRVDPSTGTIELKARFPNAARRLWPGQFVNVQLTLQTLRNVTTIPLTALIRGPNGQYVYVIDKTKHAIMRPVKLSMSADTVAVVTSGVKPGDMVVTDGQMLLKSGTLIKIANARTRRPGS